MGIRVLIVEDREDWRAILRDCIVLALGKETTAETASTYSTAMSLLKNGNYDFITVDLVLPDSSQGIILLNNLYALGIRVPAFVVSMYNREEISKKAPLYYPVHAFHQKDTFDTNRFTAEVRQMAKNEKSKVAELSQRNWDVFISYSHQDESWVVKTLLPHLEAKGLRVCIDYRDFLAGKYALVNMSDAVKQSRHTLLVLSSNWTQSDWANFEGLTSLSNDPATYRRQTIPVLLQKCDMPTYLKNITYVDFTRSDREDAAWAMLFKSLGAVSKNP